MKFGIRRPSIRKRIAARTSWKRVARHSLGFKAPRGYGWLTNPKRAAYNRLYNRTTVGWGEAAPSRCSLASAGSDCFCGLSCLRSVVRFEEELSKFLSARRL
jgi:hypothetical protein